MPSACCEPDVSFSRKLARSKHPFARTASGVSPISARGWGVERGGETFQPLCVLWLTAEGQLVSSDVARPALSLTRLTICQPLQRLTEVASRWQPHCAFRSSKWQSSRDLIVAQLKFVGRVSIGILLVLGALGACGGSSSESASSLNEGLACIDAPAVAAATAWKTGHTYSVGDQVAYNSQVYQCIKANSSSTSSNPATRTDLWLIPPSCALAEWQPQTAYEAGNVVVFNGVRYTATVAHTASASTTPGTSGGNADWKRQADISCPASDDSKFKTADLPRAASPDGVGTTVGQFSVSLGGAATYRVPIVVPPGRNSMQPNLEIAYSSESGTGLMGIGASLGGLSEIGRCSSNLSDDKQLREVRFDSSDNLCLDGMRLVAIATSGNSVEYRTQPDTFRKVTAYTSGDAPEKGPVSFVVQSKDGLVAEYGGHLSSSATSDEASSRVMANDGIVARWGISRLRDQSGNYIDFSYNNVKTAEDDGDYTAKFEPLEVRYTGHVSTSDATSSDAAPKRSVQFKYDHPRFTEVAHYAHGLHLFAPDLISQIDVNGPGGLVRSYVLSYEPSFPESNGHTLLTPTGRDRLASITEVDASGVAKSPTNLIHGSFYNPVFDPAFAFTKTDTHFPRFDISPSDLISSPFNVVTDVDGDGIEDIISVTRRLSGSNDINKPVENRLRVALQKTVQPSIQDAPPSDKLRYARGLPAVGKVSFDFPTDSSGTITWQGDTLLEAIPVDYDGDGLRDLLIVEQAPSFQGIPHQLKWMRNNGGANDGASMFDAPQDTGIDLGVKPTEHFPYFADVNGDGAPDLIMCNFGTDAKSWQGRLWQPGGFGTPHEITALSGFPCTLGQELSTNSNINQQSFQGLPSQFAAIDTNGDGADELLVAQGSSDDSAVYTIGWDWSKSEFGDRVKTSLKRLDLTHFRELDLNGDGLLDIVEVPIEPSAPDQAIGLKVLFNTGAGFVPGPDDVGASFSVDQLAEAVVLDANGDGRSDILIPSPSIGAWELLSWTTPTPHNGYSQTGFLHRVSELPTADPVRFSAARIGSPYNPDGVLWEDLGTETATVFSNQTDSVSDLLTAVRDQPVAATVGHVDGIGYSFLQATNATVAQHQGCIGCDAKAGYVGDAGCKFPMVCSRGYKPIVNTYRSSTGSGETLQTQLQYRGAHYDSLGRGWLGFSRTDMHFASPKNYTESWFADNDTLDGTERFPRAGQVTDHWVVTDPFVPSDGTHTRLQYTRLERPRANGATTFSYQLTTRDDEKLTGISLASGAPSGNVVSDTTTSFTPKVDASGVPDEAGNLSSIRVTTAGLTRKIDTSLDYDQEDTANWLVGLATHVKTVSTERVNGTTQSQSREIRVAYDHGLVRTQVLAPGDSSHELWTTLERDKFGNVTLTRTTGNESGVPATRENCTNYDAGESILPTVSGNSLGQVTRTKYDGAFGLPSQMLDVANDVAERWAYDGFGRLAQDVRPDQSGLTISRATSFGPSGEGHLSERLVDTRGTDIELRYDYAGRLIERLTWVIGAGSDPNGRASETWAYDGLSRVSSHTYPRADATQPLVSDAISFDALGRLVSLTRGNTVLRSVAYSGLTGTLTDGQKNVTTATTDAAGRMLNVVDAKTGTTSFTYGPFDAVVSVQDPVGQSKSGHLRTSTPDNYGFPLQATSPDRGAETFTFSAFGSVTTASAAGSSQTFTYDAVGRPAKLVNGDGTTQWQWDSAPHGSGKLAGVTGPDATTAISYGYDAATRPNSISTQDSEGTSTVVFKYDDQQGHGRIKELDYPDAAGAVAIGYGYDDHGNLVKLTDAQSASAIWTAKSADGSNRVTQDNLSDDKIQRARVFDDVHDGAPSSIQTHAGSATLQDLTFGYDNNDNLLTRLDRGGWVFNGKTAQSQAEAFCYDPLDRLTDVDLGSTPCAGGNEYHYSYDADGNILTKSGIGSYTYDPVHVHAVANAGSGNYGYDGRGNQITRPRAASDATGLTGTPEVHYTSLDLPKAYLSGNIVTWVADPASQPRAGGLCPGETAPAGTTSDTSMPMACLIGSDSLTLNDGAVAHLDAATKALEIGVSATLDGDVSVAGNVTLRDKSTITGTLSLSGTLSHQNTYTVGSQVQVASFTLPPIPTQTFTAGSGTFEVQNDKTITLAPGAFGNTTIRARSKTTFTAGTYKFASLLIEPGTVIRFDTSAGAINLNVTDSVDLEGPIDFGNLTGSKVALYSNGCNVTLNGSVNFPGTITAPHADVVTRNSAAIQGCVWGRQVELGPHQDAIVGSSNPYCIVENVAGKRQVSCSDNATSFVYDGTGARIAKNSASTKVRYLGGLYEQATGTKTGQVTRKYYVNSPSGPVAVLVKTRDSSGHLVGTDATQYLLTDHANSLDVVTDPRGAAVDRRSYDPFGARRPPRAGLPTSGSNDPRLVGFAGHEDDSDLGLVNMTGRVYDPALGRFLTRDPFVTNPLRSQGWNPYSYVYNNPLSWLDPSGFSTVGLDPLGCGDEVCIVVCDTCEEQGFVTAPESPSNTGYDFAPWAHIDASHSRQLLQQLDEGMTKSQNKAKRAAVQTGVSVVTWEISPAALVFVTAMGVFDPPAANAPPPGYQGIPQQGVTQRVIQIAVPVVIGGIGTGLGPKVPANPETAQIETLLQGAKSNVTEADAIVFAHGTSPESASSVVNGLDAQAASDASLGGTALENGSFFAHPVGPPSAPGEGLQLAYEWGLRHSASPAVVIGRIPGATAQRLIANGQLQILSLPGTSVPQLVFSPSSFAEVNSSVTWLQTIQF